MDARSAANPESANHCHRRERPHSATPLPQALTALLRRRHRLHADEACTRSPRLRRTSGFLLRRRPPAAAPALPRARRPAGPHLTLVARRRRFRPRERRIWPRGTGSGRPITGLRATTASRLPRQPGPVSSLAAARCPTPAPSCRPPRWPAGRGPDPATRAPDQLPQAKRPTSPPGAPSSAISVLLMQRAVPPSRMGLAAAFLAHRRLCRQRAPVAARWRRGKRVWQRGQLGSPPTLSRPHESDAGESFLDE